MERQIKSREPWKHALRDLQPTMAGKISAESTAAIFGNELIGKGFLNEQAASAKLSRNGASEYDKTTSLLLAVSTHINAASTREQSKRRFDDFIAVLAENMGLISLAVQLTSKCCEYNPDYRHPLYGQASVAGTTNTTHPLEPVNVSSSGIVNVTFANRISAALVDTVRSYASLKTAGVLIIGASLAVVAIGVLYNQVTEPEIGSFKELEQALKNVGDWDGLCRNLQVSTAMMATLRHSELQTSTKKSRCLEAFYRHDVERGVEVTWETVVKAVAEYPISNKRLAKEIAEQHNLRDIEL